jgi:type III secretion protein T
MADMLSDFDGWMKLSELVQSALTLLALCATRVYALAMVFPPMGEQSLTGVIRNAVCLMIAFFIAWGQPLSVLEHQTVGLILVLVLKEAVLGVMLGFACSMVFWVAEAVGAVIDNQAGFNNVQQSNPTTGEQSTPIGNLLAQLAQASFWMLGGMTVLIDLLIHSYSWWPLWRLAPDWSTMLPTFMQAEVSRLASWTVVLAAPISLVLLLIDWGFGLLGKAAEKLEPNSLSRPVKGVLGLLMVALLASLFFHQARPVLSLLPIQQELEAWIKSAGVSR